ncbi:MAG: NAD(P)-dependent oxidoreductase [Chloroflexota bacterium]
MFKILISDKLGQAGLDRLDLAKDAQYDMKPGLSKEELMAILPEYDALIIRSGTRADADILAAGTNLKVVGRAGRLCRQCGSRAATLRGIIVMNTPGANSATAEQAVGSDAGRQPHRPGPRLGEGGRVEAVAPGYRFVPQKRWGLWVGRICRLVAKRAQAFGMEILAYDPYVSEEIAELGVTR